jgi:hypothetical protein
MKGDINRDWKNVDWYATQSNFDSRITVSALVNGTEVRAYDFDTRGMPLEAMRLMNDMLAALRQHRGQE